jgi:hypothetical protein
MDDLTLKIDTGALVEVPAFEPDECGHNWVAVIEDRDPRAPGGLRRRFQTVIGPLPSYASVTAILWFKSHCPSSSRKEVPIALCRQE